MFDHDRLFKELLTTFFLEFVELFLPGLREHLDPDSLEFLDKEVFTDVTSGDSHEVDLVVKARIKGEEAFFLVHVEAQSERQSDFPRRMFRYFARLYEKHGLPVFPVAVFSWNEPKAVQPSTHSVAFPMLRVLDFRFEAIQLNRLSWRDFLERENPVAAALMSKMEIAPEDRYRVKASCIRLLATLRLDPARTRLLSGFVDTYLRLDPGEEKLFREEVEGLGEGVKERAMEIVTSWMEEGIRKGLVEGRLEGRLEGRRTEAGAVVLRLLGRKLGMLPAALVDRVRSLPTETLEDLGEALLDFGSVADLEAWLAAVDGPRPG